MSAAVKFVGVLLLFILVVDCKPADYLGGLVKTDLTEQDLVDTIYGRKDVKVDFGADGIKITTGYTTEQKILIAVLVGIGILCVIGCCVCCKSLCCQQDRSSAITTYQNLTTPPVRSPQYHLAPIPEGQPMPYQPPPYSATTVPNYGKY